MVQPAALLTAAVLTCATMSCAWIAPAEYAPDAGPNPPPYIVWESAVPPFEPQLTLPTNHKTTFTVKVGDADTEKTLTVRFCGRKDANPDTSFFKASLDKEISPTRDHALERPPTSEDIDVCAIFFNDTTATHYLYVFVSDGGFLPTQCDVMPGAAYALQVWSFTCTDI